MDGPGLSGRERRLLEEIESDLRQDTRLDRRLSTMGAKQPGRIRLLQRRVAQKVPPGALMTALVMGAICLSIGARTPTAPVLVAVALVWAVSVGVAVGVAALLRRRRPGHLSDADGTDLLGGEGRDRGERGGRRERGEHGERRPWDQPEA
ncbi:DUF3040 domain-containing protein [Kitasatospora sp. RG8]|uniref:DUF3040 domain-containing protein n=1 Tax=Kitasatospora sp. RG8 TaxID=2820815 RepID=UPI001AE024AB|nr:DUF3040 domain-containing protein [Kitasatospora sp. RG8]MBP0451637.1 DUF3040 domain-containing protein [Kitasatospora sp. RG8]